MRFIILICSRHSNNILCLYTLKVLHQLGNVCGRLDNFRVLGELDLDLDQVVHVGFTLRIEGNQILVLWRLWSPRPQEYVLVWGFPSCCDLRIIIDFDWSAWSGKAGGRTIEISTLIVFRLFSRRHVPLQFYNSLLILQRLVLQSNVVLALVVFVVEGEVEDKCFRKFWLLNTHRVPLHRLWLERNMRSFTRGWPVQAVGLIVWLIWVHRQILPKRLIDLGRGWNSLVRLLFLIWFFGTTHFHHFTSVAASARLILLTGAVTPACPHECHSELTAAANSTTDHLSAVTEE